MSQSTPTTPAPRVENARVAVIAAEWNGHITSVMARSAVDTLKAHGLEDKDIDLFNVPGTVELTYAASQVIDASIVDAVIVFGVVVRGDTPHFDYVCQSVTQGVTELNANYDTPVIFGVLTVNDEQQAIDRIAGGSCGDKGAEAAEAALKMIAFKRSLD